MPPLQNRETFEVPITMSIPNIKVTFEIKPDSYEMLKQIQSEFELQDTSKALRVLLDYAATDGDWKEIFGKIRCPRCG